MEKVVVSSWLGNAEMYQYISNQGIRKRGDEKVLALSVSLCMGGLMKMEEW
jgi:hypothetical protein